MFSKMDLTKDSKITIDLLHPTQISIGLQQVLDKEKKILSKHNIDNYLKKKIVPIIIGPHNIYYMIDHHHLTRTIYNLDLKYVYYKILKDWSYLNYNDFWYKMYNKKFIWLYDEKGNKLDLKSFLDLLPNHVKHLKNDPYRSLAGIIRKKKGFNKDWTPFSEFIWANFYRNFNLDLSYDNNNITENIIKKAINISNSSLAKDLPGYIISS